MKNKRSVKLDTEQMKAIRNLGSGSILCGGVGSGKSLTALGYYFTHILGGTIKSDGEIVYREPDKEVQLVIITIAMKRDNEEWIHEILSYPINFESVTIDSWNNIGKYQDVKNAFFIFDEQRVVGYGAWTKSFLKIARFNKWIMLSATPGDVWIDYMPVFIANGFYRNKTDFTNRHVMYQRYSKFPIIQRYVEVSRLEKLRDKILVNMEVKRHTTRHYKIVKPDFDTELYRKIEKIQINTFTNEPIKSKSELLLALRRVANSDDSRLDLLGEILDNHPRIVLFYNFNYELDALTEYLDYHEIPYAQRNGHKHENIPPTKEWVYLVQYMSGAEGWNCITTDTMVFYSLNYSYRLFEQASGRIDRRNTPYTDLNYYVMRSNATIDRRIHKAIERKKDFNIRSY